MYYDGKWQCTPTSRQAECAAPTRRSARLSPPSSCTPSPLTFLKWMSFLSILSPLTSKSQIISTSDSSLTFCLHMQQELHLSQTNPCLYLAGLPSGSELFRRTDTLSSFLIVASLLGGFISRGLSGEQNLQ